MATRARRPGAAVTALTVGLLVALAIAVHPAAAQAPAATPDRRSVGPAPTTEDLSTYTYQLRHQSAEAAIALARPLLSPRGTIELLPDRRTLIVRDSLSAISRIVTTWSGFDRPAVPVGLRVQLVRAASSERPGPAGTVLVGEVADRLRRLLRFDSYTLLSETRVVAREGDVVAYEFSRAGYRVEFRLGSILPGQRVRLHAFRVWRRVAEESRELIHTTVNLPMTQPFVLGLTSDESSGAALFIVLTHEPPEER